MKILDFGCGNGDNIYFLSAENKNNEVIGADLDIASATSKYPQLKFIELKNGSLPFADDYFDTIYASDVLEHVGDLELAIAEITRVLKSAGRFIISIPHYKTEKILAAVNPGYLKQIGHQRIFSADEMEKLLGRAGFKIASRKQTGSFMFFALWLLLKNKRNIVIKSFKRVYNKQMDIFINGHLERMIFEAEYLQDNSNGVLSPYEMSKEIVPLEEGCGAKDLTHIDKIQIENDKNRFRNNKIKF